MTQVDRSRVDKTLGTKLYDIKMEVHNFWSYQDKSKCDCMWLMRVCKEEKMLKFVTLSVSSSRSR